MINEFLPILVFACNYSKHMHTSLLEITDGKEFVQVHVDCCVVVHHYLLWTHRSGPTTKPETYNKSESSYAADLQCHRPETHFTRHDFP